MTTTRTPDTFSRAAFGALLAAATPACMLSPTWGDEISSTAAAVSFSFYATESNRAITVDCAPGLIGAPFTNAFTIQSGTSPWTYNGETVYPTSTSRVLPSHCWGTFHGRPTTRLRPRQDGRSMMVYDDDGIDCIGEAFANGDGPTTAGYACRLTYSNSNNALPYVVIHARP
jgi:hypothetical protein